MADRLARIFGTEEDKVNCPFYFKIGACRHGDRCSRLHNKPPFSQTLLLTHMYQNHPASVAAAEGQQVSEEHLREAAKHFEDFYEEVFSELMSFGEVEEMNVCDNIGDHLVGNVYVKFASEEQAEKAFKALNGRFYAGRPIMPEFSPVTDFREARCRQFDESQCQRGGYCNFMHLKYVSRSLKRDLFRQMYEEHPEYKRRAEQEASKGGGSPRRDPRDGPVDPRDREDRRAGDGYGGRDGGRGGGRGGGGGGGGGGRDYYNREPQRDYRDRRDGRDGRDRDRERDRDRDRDAYRRRSRSRERDSRRRSRSRERERPREERRSPGRQSSEERRAMIEQWNREAEQAAQSAASAAAAAGIQQ